MAVYNYIISFGIPGDANSGVTFENIIKIKREVFIK